MDKDRLSLPRFADLGAQHSDRSIIDNDEALAGRHRATSQTTGSKSDPAPLPLHPPPTQSYSALRPELLYQPTLASHRTHTGAPSFHAQRSDRHRTASPPAYSQSLPGLSKYEDDAVVHSPPPTAENSLVPGGLAPYAPYGRPQQQGGVSEGAVAKPKKLHREVEQKRRMRMAEQIVELRKWVSNPNGGKTDKVSVLQDAVTFVKDSAKKIEDLHEALERSRAECAHLRNLLNKAGTRHDAPASVQPPLGSHTNLGAPSTHLVGQPSHAGLMATRPPELARQSRFSSAHPVAFPERQARLSGTLAPNSGGANGQSGLGVPSLAPSSFVVAPSSALMERPRARAPHELGALGPMSHFRPSDMCGASRPAPATAHVRALPGASGYYDASRKGSGTGMAAGRGRDAFAEASDAGDGLPRLEGGEPAYEARRQDGM